MIKKIIIGVVIVVVGFLAYTFLTTRSHSPETVTSFNLDGTEISVRYCQPFKKGRLIFGEESADALVPFGEYWRLGANDATEITFSTDVNFGGEPLNAGTYRMYAVPGKDSWKVTLNSELGKFGAFEPDEELDVLSVDASVSTSSAAVEQFTIQFDKSESAANMAFVWDNTVAKIAISK